MMSKKESQDIFERLDLDTPEKRRKYIEFESYSRGKDEKEVTFIEIRSESKDGTNCEGK